MDWTTTEIYLFILRLERHDSIRIVNSKDNKGEADEILGFFLFVNKTGTASGKNAAEVGTIVVKENIGNDNKLKALTVMYKVEGFNPENGDWFWAKYIPKGKVDKSGKVTGCIGCHTSVEDNDYIFVHEFK